MATAGSAPVVRHWGIDAHLESVRAHLRRLTPREAFDRMGRGAPLVDTRPEFQRRADGEVPGALVIERNHLEWRLDPSSTGRITEATRHDLEWVVLCDEGYSSSLAAASLRELGLRRVSDVIGGFQRWRDDGLPVAHPDVPEQPRLWLGGHHHQEGRRR